jgi:hypothetical protein
MIPNLTLLPNFTPFVLRIDGCPDRSGLLQRSGNTLAILSDNVGWHIRHFWNRYLKDNREVLANRRELQSLAPIDILDHFYYNSMSLKHLLITGSDCFEEPRLSDEMRQRERQRLQGVLEGESIRVIAGSLKGTLHPTGTFSYTNRKDKEVSDRDSVQFLWEAYNTPKNDDPTFALRRIFIASNANLSLYEYSEEDYSDMPALAPLNEKPTNEVIMPTPITSYSCPTPITAYSCPTPITSYSSTSTPASTPASMPASMPASTPVAILNRLKAKKAALERDLAHLKEALVLQEENKVLEGSIQTIMIQLAE